MKLFPKSGRGVLQEAGKSIMQKRAAVVSGTPKSSKHYAKTVRAGFGDAQIVEILSKKNRGCLQEVPNP